MEIAFKIIVLLVFMPSIANEHSSEKYCLVKAFDELHRISVYMCEQIEKLLSKIIETSPLVKRLQVINLKLAGSLAEGSFLSRWFLPRKNSTSILANLEADVETTIGEISLSRKHCLKDVRNKPGFIHVQVVSKNCFCPVCMKSTGNKFRETLPQDFEQYVRSFSDRNGFLMPKKIKLQSQKENSHFKEVHLENARAVAALVLNKPLAAFTASNFFTNLTKATFTLGYDIAIESTMEARLSLDFSFNFKLDWIPDVTSKWLIKHNHKWPPIEKFQDELSYSYIIAKPSCAEKNNENTTEFRYSFAHIERKIFSLMSDTQRLVYMIFKAMFYKWIIPIDEEIVMSYIAKTVMLWITEEYQPDDVLWKEDSASIFNAIQILFQRLVQYCQQKFLPYFFVPQINAFECMPLQTIELIGKKAEDIGRNITIYIPDNIEEVKTLAEEVVMIFEVIKSFAKDANTFDQMMEMFFNDNLINEP